MTAQVACPNCLKPIDSHARSCEYCGADLALAAALAERKMIDLDGSVAPALIAPEILAPRMGETMIEMGLIRPEQLKQALDYQRERAAKGRPALLGQTMIDLGFIDRETLDKVTTIQILNLQNALTAANQELEARVRQRTADLQRALERLAELNQLKSNFIANISHELRTPLTHLKGYLDLLADNGLGPLNPAQADAIDVLRRAEGRLEKLIEDLLQFSLAARGEVSLKMTAVDLVKLIRMTVDRVTFRARAASINLACRAPESLPLVRADEEKIGWVLQQLLDNALKFTPQGGRVLVEAMPRNGVVVVAITDTGIGIAPQRLKELFEPFHQLDGSATRHYGGTGMGLAMARQIIEAHEARITVQSVVGRGARFEFFLPVILQ
jgi:signal transduction histidine kinase